MLDNRPNAGDNSDNFNGQLAFADLDWLWA